MSQNLPANELGSTSWDNVRHTCVMRVLQVEESGSFLLPDLLIFLQLLPQFVEGRHPLRKETFLKAQMQQKHVQRDGSHHEPHIKRESGAQDLHAGPGVSGSINLTGAALDREH